MKLPKVKYPDGMYVIQAKSGGFIINLTRQGNYYLKLENSISWKPLNFDYLRALLTRHELIPIKKVPIYGQEKE